MSTRASTRTRTGAWTALTAALFAMLAVAAWLTVAGDDDEPFEVVPPVVTGAPLDPYQPGEILGDDAIAPVATGAALLGTEGVRVPVAGQPTLVVFLAHWCNVCQSEVPVMASWIEGGGVPDGVALRAVATAIDPLRPNHPPDAWLEREGWRVQTLVDDGRLAGAYGLTSFPFWAFIDADGRVVGRAAGALGAEQLSAVARSLAS